MQDAIMTQQQKSGNCYAYDLVRKQNSSHYNGCGKKEEYLQFLSTQSSWSYQIFNNFKLKDCVPIDFQNLSDKIKPILQKLRNT